jgi:CHAT domain-containing protein
MEAALDPRDIVTVDLMADYVTDLAAQGDRTMAAILAPLQTERRSQTLEARRLVQQGLDMYFDSKPIDSLRFYVMAEHSLGDASVFDSLWIQLKTVDTRARVIRTDAEGRQVDLRKAMELVDHVIDRSRSLHFDWLLGQALVAKGNILSLTTKQDEILPLWDEAVKLLMTNGGAKDASRPLYYKAYVHGLAGDTETSLAIAYRSLGLTDPKTRPREYHVRMVQLYWLLSFQINKLGYSQYAAALAEQALDEAILSPNPGLLAYVMPLLAATHASGDARAAKQYLAQANRARQLMTNDREKASLDRTINLFCGQVGLKAGDFDTAEECLNRNVRVFEQEPKAAPYIYPETLLTLAQLNFARGRLDDARQQLRVATQVIEKNDAYYATPELRMPFEGQRRNIYDTAIGFEYDFGDRDAAWGYMQRYRAKLFLELLQQMNPLAGVLDRAIDRSRVQELIPDTVQVLEYTMLQDRLLIWLVSGDKFVSAKVSIRREDLDRKVAEFVARINNKDEFRSSSAELYKILIEPIASSLDPQRALAIIPDLSLHRLNFAALYSPEAQKFLIQQHVLLESPSLTTLLAAGSAAPSRSPMVKFGARIDTVGVTRELRDLNRFYPDAQEFNRSAALKPAFLSSLREALVFQYSGHSQDAADPLRSAILLDGEREGPNSITAVDISRTRMRPNSVVILASCDSSVGNSRDGIGMRGLTSAFLISGAGSVVGSLWLVESQSTSQLVIDFHRNFAEDKMPVAASLRNAQLALIKEGKHPYEWSGFVVTGNLSALR